MSVFGPSSLGRSPNLDRMSYYGSGHVTKGRSGHVGRSSSGIHDPVTGIRNLPEPRPMRKDVLGQGVQGLPNQRDSVPFQEKTRGPFVIPDGSNITPYDRPRSRRDMDRDLRDYREETKIPVIIYEGPKCGGPSCNLYKKSMSPNYTLKSRISSNSMNYASDPTESCTCCSKGKKCRNSKFAPNMVKYNDCCPGSDCFTEFDTDEYGHCS